MKITELYEFRIYLNHDDEWCIDRKQQVKVWYRKPYNRWMHYWYIDSTEKLRVLKGLKTWIERERKKERVIEYTYFSEATLDKMIAEEEAKNVQR